MGGRSFEMQKGKVGIAKYKAGKCRYHLRKNSSSLVTRKLGIEALLSSVRKSAIGLCGKSSCFSYELIY